MSSLHNSYLNGKKLSDNYLKKNEKFWIKNGQESALKLFHDMSIRVPAYKDFLQKYNINPRKIITIQDFEQLPTLDKNNYLRCYSLKDLSWDGSFPHGQYSVSATSGSTGDPYYFPRTKEQDLQYAAVAEVYLRTNFKIHKQSTLYIIGFPMGIWIGGVFTYQALQYLSDRGNYDMSIITPGIHKEEIIKSIKNLGSYYDQIIIGSYGPFLKDVLDDGEAAGLDWKKYNIKFVFSAEGFSEEFRDSILEKAGSSNVYTDSLNHYGTVDLGTMAYETPLAIMVRRRAIESSRLYKDLFGPTHRLPTLCQYDPRLFYFEQTMQNGLLCSARSGIPLVRYDLKDNGGCFNFSELKKMYDTEGRNLSEDTERAQISHTVSQLPFVYVYERSDFSVSFHAFQIYPETIRKALQRSPLISSITTKFTMMVEFDKNQDQVLIIHIEMKRNKLPDKALTKKLKEIIFKSLVIESSEYRETYSQKGKKVLPKIVLWKYEDPLYFKPGTKQRWVSKIK